MKIHPPLPRSTHAGPFLRIGLLSARRSFAELLNQIFSVTKGYTFVCACLGHRCHKVAKLKYATCIICQAGIEKSIQLLTRKVNLIMLKNQLDCNSPSPLLAKRRLHPPRDSSCFSALCLSLILPDGPSWLFSYFFLDIASPRQLRANHQSLSKIQLTRLNHWLCVKYTDVTPTSCLTLSV